MRPRKQGCVRVNPLKLRVDGDGKVRGDGPGSGGPDGDPQARAEGLEAGRHLHLTRGPDNDWRGKEGTRGGMWSTVSNATYIDLDVCPCTEIVLERMSSRWVKERWNLRILQLRFRECRARRGRPVHRLEATVNVPVQKHGALSRRVQKSCESRTVKRLL